jgi:hypothetical protein
MREAFRNWRMIVRPRCRCASNRSNFAKLINFQRIAARKSPTRVRSFSVWEAQVKADVGRARNSLRAAATYFVAVLTVSAASAEIDSRWTSGTLVGARSGAACPETGCRAADLPSACRCRFPWLSRLLNCRSPSKCHLFRQTYRAELPAEPHRLSRPCSAASTLCGREGGGKCKNAIIVRFINCPFVANSTFDFLLFQILSR